MDLHLHTPASSDYEQENVTYLEVLKQAEAKGLDIIAFTDHNTVAGYSTMLAEIENLEFLERLDRLQPEETQRLGEYRRLMAKILVLPGFEITATLGFHVIGLFSPETLMRELELMLLRLGVPGDVLDEGITEVGATSDVLTVYRAIAAAGGIVIAAHANTTHGVAMRGMGFGGQTRIAYTQDPNLHALEVTDLEKKGRRTTAAFFDGSKPEYPRRLRCIQGSDAHRLTADPRHKNRLGIGDRATEALLPEVSFEALRGLFLGDDFARTRPARQAAEKPFDHVQSAREAGPTIVQSFHERMTRRGGRLYAVIADVCALANTNGGTVYVGVSANPGQPPVGVEGGEQAVQALKHEIERKITPPLEVKVDVLDSRGRQVLRLDVPRGGDPPYAIDESKIYVRQEAETSLAVRDEIVAMVRRASRDGVSPAEVAAQAEGIQPPRTGVEIVETVERKGTLYHTVRDLRQGNTVQNVSRRSARRLWHYAITQKEEQPVDPARVQWQGDVGLWKKRTRSGQVRYDLVQRMPDGSLHVYYGVTEEGIDGEWKALVGDG
ncbi:MAG: putative DNA binding domain-containing protein [Anaerolineae bacterium]|nr:MAG: putative DNA binding domain-containing protein [Anaerolineae bacterium]